MYKSRLKDRQLAYEGMVYLEVASKVVRGTDIGLPYDAYCFVGFNALNECEKKLFDFFRKSGKALFFWDYDDYYIKNAWHEAGLFLRENIRRYPSPALETETEFFTRQKKEVSIIAANNDVAQAKILPQLLEKEMHTNTCVVLSDESLLVPVLSSLPENIQRVNVTMGYPFSNSPAFTLLELFIRLFRSVRKDQDLGKLYYHREILAILQHPYLQQVYASESADIIATIFKRKPDLCSGF
ncbi:MAG: hypothetical protein HC830_06890 [Bacteroidetes bacterium]|nr:hypothetical protein [Bacteroidota bacterium]